MWAGGNHYLRTFTFWFACIYCCHLNRRLACIPNIRLFTRHVLSANSSLKSYIKSTRVNVSRNPSESLKNLLYLQDCVKFTRLNFSRFWYSCEHSRKWMHSEKTCYAVICYQNDHFSTSRLTLCKRYFFHICFLNRHLHLWMTLRSQQWDFDMLDRLIYACFHNKWRKVFMVWF